ncbi:hypothetical protein RQP46_005609 [Phenoliferia psychrophenolica]
MTFRVDPNAYPTLVGGLYVLSILSGTLIVISGLSSTFDPPMTALPTDSTQQHGLVPRPNNIRRSNITPMIQNVRSKVKVLLISHGIRTLAIGVNLIAFALLRDRRGTGIATLLAIVVLRADGIVNVAQGTPIEGVKSLSKAESFGI